MRSRSALIVDNFYKNVYEIRELALSLRYQPKKGAMYPGGEAWSGVHDWEIVRQEIMDELGEGVDEKIPKGKEFKQGKFRLALGRDGLLRPDGIHQDVQRYSGIVYLSRDVDCQGGVGLYRCRMSGQTSMNSMWLQTLSRNLGVSLSDPLFVPKMRAYCSDWGNWDQIGELPMRFNRLIVLMAQCFHASTGIFGDTPESGRLTQHFEMYL